MTHQPRIVILMLVLTALATTAASAEANQEGQQHAHGGRPDGANASRIDPPPLPHRPNNGTATNDTQLRPFNESVPRPRISSGSNETAPHGMPPHHDGGHPDGIARDFGAMQAPRGGPRDGAGHNNDSSPGNRTHPRLANATFVGFRNASSGDERFNHTAPRHNNNTNNNTNDSRPQPQREPHGRRQGATFGSGPRDVNVTLPRTNTNGTRGLLVSTGSNASEARGEQQRHMPPHHGSHGANATLPPRVNGTTFVPANGIVAGNKQQHPAEQRGGAGNGRDDVSTGKGRDGVAPH